MSGKNIWKEVGLLIIFFIALIIFYPGASQTRNATESHSVINNPEALGWRDFFEKKDESYLGNPQNVKNARLFSFSALKQAESRPQTEPSAETLLNP